MVSFLLLLLLNLFAANAIAAIPELPKGATVRFKIAELDKAWQVGTVDISKEGCVMIWVPDAKVSGGRRGYGLLFIHLLERQQGSSWVTVPVEPLTKKEPTLCQEGAD